MRSCLWVVVALLAAILVASPTMGMPTIMASMAHDLLRGNRIELPWLAGRVVSLGRELGVPTPTNAFIYAALKAYANGTP